MTPLLDVIDLTYSYDGSHQVLSNINFQIPDSKIIGLVGPNGSGKSTLIRCIFDLLKLQSGKIFLHGFPHDQIPAKIQALYLTSNDYLPEYITPHEYYNLLARLYEVPCDRDRGLELFDKFSMSHRYDDLIADFSHGMRKKTQLIAALMLRRQLTVIDETLNGIDIESIRIAESEIRKLRDDGHSVLLCSHDFRMLEAVADDVIFLNHGMVEFSSPLQSVIGHSDTLEGVIFRLLDSESR